MMQRRVIAWTLLSALLCSSMAAFAQDDTHEPPPSETADDEVASEGEEAAGKVKILEFTDLDIAGRMKSPQLLYFLERLRAEFDRPKLPHRSFMPELVRSTKGTAF